MLAGRAVIRPKKQAMKTVNCSHCNGTFDFDSKKVWTSPGNLTNPHPIPVVIECPLCKRWLRITLNGPIVTAEKHGKDSTP